MSLLEVTQLKKAYKVRPGEYVHAVNGVSFQLEPGETLGIVGESGCGKSTMGRLVMRLEDPTHGRVVFDNVDITALSQAQMRRHRKDIQIIFQDPYASLDPRMSIYRILAEPLVTHKLVDSERQLGARIDELLGTVGLQTSAKSKYPHEFSGGQRQRICIARALAMRPKLIVCDEPVSALDVSIQSHILNLLAELQKEFGMAYIFISHALNVVSHISDRVGVMYLGKMVEIADRNALYENPSHPYSMALLSAIPQIDKGNHGQRIVLQGDIPDPIHPPSGCSFHTRCLYATRRCGQEEPALADIGGGHRVACHYAGQLEKQE